MMAVRHASGLETATKVAVAIVVWAYYATSAVLCTGCTWVNVG